MFLDTLNRLELETTTLRATGLTTLDCRARCALCCHVCLLPRGRDNAGGSIGFHPAQTLAPSLKPHHLSGDLPSTTTTTATTTANMGRVRTKVTRPRTESDRESAQELMQIISDGQEIGKGHHRTILPQTHPRFRDQQADMRRDRHHRVETLAQQGP